MTEQCDKEKKPCKRTCLGCIATSDEATKLIYSGGLYLTCQLLWLH